MGRNWTEKEDSILRDLVNKYGKQWGLISSHIPNRTASQVAARWEKCLDPNLKKGPFKPEEDLLIANFVAENGPRSWPRITAILPHRSAKQCRERWFNHLDPSVTKSEWTQEEDEKIFQEHEKYGGRWSMMVKLFPGRTDNALKNRWNSSVSRRIATSEQGVRFVLPDSSKRRYRQKERPSFNTEVNSTKTETKKHPPPLEIPRLDVSSGVSPTIPFTPFSIQTPMLPSADGGMFSPISPMSGFPMTPGDPLTSLASTPRGEPFLLSPKQNLGDAFK